MSLSNVFAKISIRQWRAMVAWVLLWLVPWGVWVSVEGSLFLIFLLDMIKLLVAVAMFIVPGVFLYLLLRTEDNVTSDDPIGVLPVGFALSVTVIALIGFAGRVLGVPFTVVKVLFACVGLTEWLALNLTGKFETIRVDAFRSIPGKIWKNIPLTTALVLSVLMMLNDHLFFIDDFTYLAYLTSWQNSTHLGFTNIIHQADVLEIERFWLAMYPMGQAIISELSGVPGALLLSNYLEPILVLFAVSASYWFGRALGLSERAAGFSVLFQVSLYTWMVGDQWPAGFWYFFNLAEDKVSAVFILSPVFFFFILNFLHRRSWRNFFLALLAGAGLSLTHPVILFFACLISAGLGMMALLVKKTGWRELALLAVILILLVLPYIAIRLRNYSTSAGFSADAKSIAASFEADKYTRVVSNIFYGINPEVLMFFDLPTELDSGGAFQLFRTFPFLLASLAGVWSLVNLRKGPLYWYVSVCVVLVSLATIPYTGWVLGYLSDARLMSRVSWYSPLGLGGILLLFSLAGRFKASRPAGEVDRNNSIKILGGDFWGLALCLFFASPMILLSSLPRTAQYFQVLDHVRQLANIGDQIDKDSSPPVTVIALDYIDIQMLPGVSANTSLISYREEKDDNGHNFFFSTDEIHNRIFASNTIRSLEMSIPCNVRATLMEKFDVKYIVSPLKDVEKFMEIMEACKIPVELKYQTVDMALLKMQ